MLIFSLLETQQSKTLQQWQFEKDSLVRIGRASDNHAVIDNDLISRYHLELHQIQPQQWQLISKGTNGTFFKGQRIDKLILSTGLEVQLAQGGPWLKFELSPAAETETPPISIIAKLPSPEPPIIDPTESDFYISQLEIILSGLNVQFSKSFLSQRKEEINKRLGEIQKLLTKLKEAVNLVEKNSQYPEILFKSLSEAYEDLELQKQTLKEFQPRLEEVQQLLEEFQKHLESNVAVAQQLPTQKTRVAKLIETVQQQLDELDQELGRIHAQHLLNSAKRSLSL